MSNAIKMTRRRLPEPQPKDIARRRLARTNGRRAQMISDYVGRSEDAP